VLTLNVDLASSQLHRQETLQVTKVLLPKISFTTLLKEITSQLSASIPFLSTTLIESSLGLGMDMVIAYDLRLKTDPV